LARLAAESIRNCRSRRSGRHEVREPPLRALPKHADARVRDAVVEDHERCHHRQPGSTTDDDGKRRIAMTDKPRPGTRWRLLRDVVVFQVKLGMEAVLDITLIPLSLAAAALDFVLGNWRQPRLFHAVLRFGERCEHRIDLWGAAKPGMDAPPSDADALLRGIERLARNPGIAPDKVRELRRWAATKLAPNGDRDLQPPDRRTDLPG
jgi:hypothetical protein